MTRLREQRLRAKGRDHARPQGRIGWGVLALAALLAATGSAWAQGVVIPNFWDPNARQERPEVSTTRSIRFLTDDDFPPLHFSGPGGAPTGFVVELARAACERLNLTCTIQARRFDTLLDSLGDSRGDVLAAAIPLTPEVRKRFTATLPFFRIPARFAARLDKNQPEPSPKAVEGRSVAVLAGTAHEAYLKAFFPKAELKPFPDLPAAEAAVRRGDADYVFADGLGLALWLGGTDAAGCCGFAGGPYLESRYFGEGVGFLLRKEDDALRQALGYALHRLWDEGKYAELYLRFFPIGPF